MQISHPTPAVFAILFSLAGGERHGYAMMKDARTPEGGGVDMGPGTLYGTLERMVRDGLVIEADTSDDQRRRYYRLTDSGRAVLEAELARMQATLQAAHLRGLFPAGGRA